MAEKAFNLEQYDGLEFCEGDLAVYPAHGVGRIEAIETREINEITTSFYIMKIFENGMVIMIPTGNTESVGLRKVIEKHEIPEIYVVLKQDGNPVNNKTWNRRYREYMDKIKTGSLFDVAEVFRDLYLLRLHKDLSFGERKLLDTANGLLIKELCIATGSDDAVILAHIETIFEGR